MKLKVWLLSALAPLTAVSVLAQASNSVPPALTPPPAVSSAAEPVAEPPAAKPAKEAAKPKHHKAKAKEAKAPATTNNIVVLDQPMTAAVKCDVLDVRAQGSFAGEVITHLKKGDNVTVLAEINLGHAHANEPHKWSRIVMPANTAVWVSAAYIDPANDTVRVKKVNVRGGPGENYSVIAQLDKGSVVKEVGKKEGWLSIEPPTNAYAFVASEYLEKQGEAPAPVVAAPPQHAALPAPTSLHVVSEPPVVVNVPAETAPVVAKPAEPPPAGLAAPAPTAASEADQERAALHRATAPQPLVAATAPAPEPVKEDAQRIVTREGFVHRAYNIQAPTGYELHDIKTGEATEFLQPAPGQKFKIYIGTRVRIVGSESLDPNWPRTPVLQVQTIDLMP